MPISLAYVGPCALQLSHPSYTETRDRRLEDLNLQSTLIND